MSSLMIFIALCLSSSLVCAQAPPGSISGRITLAQQPLPGVTVLLDDEATVPSKARRTKTDSEGRYRFTDVAAGRHVVLPHSPAYVLPAGGIWLRAGKELIVAANEQIADIDFDLTPGGVITGRITDSRGHPVIQQIVKLHWLNAEERTRELSGLNPVMFQTDDRGVYRVFGLPAGRYFVSVGEGQGSPVTEPGHSYWPLTYYRKDAPNAEATAVIVAAGDEVTGIDIQLGKSEKTYEARGCIVATTTGEPLAGVPLSYGARMSNTFPGINSFGRPVEYTNAAGEFVLAGLKSGNYSVFLAAEPGNEYYAAPAYFEVHDHDVEGLKLEAQRGASLSGQVVVEGATAAALGPRVQEVQLRALAYTQSLPVPTSSSAQPQADGTFQLTGLLPGKITLRINPPLPLHLLRYERDGRAVSDFELTAGERVTGVKIVLGYGTGVLRGKVAVIGGTLPAEARLMVSCSRLPDATTRAIGTNGMVAVDARGKFVLAGLLPGTYDVRLQPQGLPGVTSLRNLHEVKQRVVVEAGDTTITFTIDLREKREASQ